MLKKGRVDAVLDYKKDIKPLWKILELGEKFVVLDDVIVENVYPGFAVDRLDLKQHYDKSFLKLYQSGEIRKMMLKHKLSEARIPMLKNEEGIIILDKQTTDKVNESVVE